MQYSQTTFEIQYFGELRNSILFEIMEVVDLLTKQPQRNEIDINSTLIFEFP